MPSLLKAGLAGLAIVLALAAALLAIPADEARAHPDRHPGNYPLHQAAGRYGDLAAVIHLLGSAHGIDVNAKAPAGIDVNRFNDGTPLHFAAVYGRATIVATLIAAGADVNATTSYYEVLYGAVPFGETPLHVLTQAPSEARPKSGIVASLLLAAGADVNAKNGHRGDTSLHNAAFQGLASVVSVLLAAGADLEAKSNNGSTPLHWAAARYGHAAVVAALIAAGAEVNAKSNGGQTPLHRAAYYGHAAIVATLIASGAEVNAKDNHGDTPLRDAWHDFGNRFHSYGRGAASVLIAAGGHWGEACAGLLTVNPAGPTIPCVCESPNVGTTDNCQAPSAQICRGLTPPQFYSPTLSACAPYSKCIGAGDCELSASICRQGFTPGWFYDAAADECGGPLYPCHDSAIRKADNSGCECAPGDYAHGDPSGGEWNRHDARGSLWERYCERETSSYYFQPGQRCATEEWRKSIPDTAECHADHAPVAHGLNDWAAAITMNSHEVVSHFIAEHGQGPDSILDLYCPGVWRIPPLHCAARIDSDRAALALIEGGANVNLIYGGETPLHYAARNSSFRIAKALLNRGANPDAIDSDGDTALHESVRLSDATKNVALVSLLLDKGANPNIRNDDRWRPLDLAYGRGDQYPPRRDMMAALIAGGADWSDKCTGGAIPNEHAGRGASCVCPSHFIRVSSGACECPAHSHSQVNGRCLRKDSAQVELEIAKMRLELERLRLELAELNRRLTLLADAPETPPEMLEEVAKQAAQAARGIAQRRNNFLALARAGLAEADDAGPAPLLALSDTEATCRMLAGEVQTHSRSGAKICSEVDANDTFCIVGSASAFPCVGFFRHVRRCNDDYNRPALDPWHCGKQCADGLRARGAKCKAE